MFDQLVNQARRLFSSKSNAGKQVANFTDRLHIYKQFLVAISIILILGYSQFRDHFECQGYGNIDKKTITNFCLINGTTTVVKKSVDEGALADTHTGLAFATNDDDIVIGHNYMRSYWPLLISLAICSHLAQKRWASVFENEVLRALLQLVGSSESRFVRAAENAKPYEMLSTLSSDLNQELHSRTAADPDYDDMSRDEKVSRRIEIVDSYVNIYDHALDYYPNQITYLLLTKNTASFRLSCLKLRRTLIHHALISTYLSISQFVLLLVFFGSEYTLYGFRYLGATVRYVVGMCTGLPGLANSIDYELSSRIFPTVAQCEYKQFAMVGSTERITVQCTIAINEICSKLFVLIWWLVVFSIMAELWSLLMISICSLSARTLSWTFGLRFWPQARKEANLIASFRHKRSMLLTRRQLIKQLRSSGDNSAKGRAIFDVSSEQIKQAKKLQAQATSAIEDSSSERTSKRWYLWCPRDVSKSLADLSVKLVCCQADKRHRHLQCEVEKDVNIYYLLYLIYMRLNHSKSKVEEVIKMTACALSNYLADLETHCENLRMATEVVQKNNCDQVAEKKSDCIVGVC